MALSVDRHMALWKHHSLERLMPSTSSDEKCAEKTIIQKQEVSVGCRYATALPALPSLAVMIRSTRFQLLLKQKKGTEALAMISDSDSPESIDCSQVYAPQPYVSPFYYVLQMNASEIQTNLLKALKRFGGVTKEALYAFDENGVNAMMDELRNRCGLALFESLGFQLKDLDWNHRSSNTALTWSLSISRESGAPMTVESSNVHDQQASRLVPYMNDDTLNTVTLQGWTAIAFAVKNLRPKTLEALLLRLPGVELDPEFLHPPKNVAPVSLEDAMAVGVSDGFPSDAERREVIRGMLQSARTWMGLYYDQLPLSIKNALAPDFPSPLIGLVCSFLVRNKTD